MKRDAAFVMFTGGPIVLMTCRHDGSWGFPGGKVEEGESLLQAARRECLEEIGVKFDMDDVQYICQHEINPKMDSHLFVFELVSLKTLSQHVYSATLGQASHSHEVAGAALFNVDRVRFTEMNLAPTVLEELYAVFGDRIK